MVAASSNAGSRGFHTWASFAPPLKVTAIWSGEPPSPAADGSLKRSLPGFAYPILTPPRLSRSHPFLVGSDPTLRHRRLPFHVVVTSPVPSSSLAAPTSRGDCPGQFQRRSHRLHHVLEAQSCVLFHIHEYWRECDRVLDFRESFMDLGRSKESITMDQNWSEN